MFLAPTMSGLMYPTEESRPSGSCLDSEKVDTGFISFFRNIPATVPGTVRLFNRQDFYAAYGDDALYVADTVFKTKSVLRYLGGKSREDIGLPSCSLSLTAAKSFLRDALTTKQLRVEIWASTSGDGSGKRGSTWAIAKQASPGNLQELEDLLFLQSDVVSSPIVLALRIKVEDGLNQVGAAFADATNREFGIAEYAETDLFSNSEVSMACALIFSSL